MNPSVWATNKKQTLGHSEFINIKIVQTQYSYWYSVLCTLLTATPIS